MTSSQDFPARAWRAHALIIVQNLPIQVSRRVLLELHELLDLVETRVSGGDTVRCVPAGDMSTFADEVERLISDPDLRVELARRARRRVSEQLDWRAQAEVYHGVFDELSGRRTAADTTPEPGWSQVDDWGRRYDPLTDEAEFERYILERRAP